MVSTWRLEIEHCAGNTGWIHPVDRPKEVRLVTLPQGITKPHAAANRKEVQEMVHNNPNFRSRIRSITLVKEAIA